MSESSAPADTVGGGASPAAAAAPLAELLLTGGDLIRLTVVAGALVSTPIHLYYESNAKIGVLNWCDVGSRSLVKGQSIPLHRVSDVYLGKHATYREVKGAEDIRTARCFTLSSKAVTLHLAAKDQKLRTEWIAAIKSIYAKVGKKVDEPKVEANAPLAPVPESASEGVTSPKPEEESKENAVAPTPTVIVHVASPAQKDEEKSSSPPDASVDAPSAAVDAPVVAAPVAEPVAAPAAPVVAPVAAPLVAPVVVPVAAISRTVVVEDATPLSPMASPTNAVAVAADTVLAEGQKFKFYSLDTKGVTLSKQYVVVWMETVASVATLFWTVAPKDAHVKSVRRVKVAGQLLPLSEITDVLVGKHVEEFTHADATHLEASCCLSLRSQTHVDHNLNLVTSSPLVQRRWIQALKRAFALQPSTRVESKGVKSGVIPVEAMSSPKSIRVMRRADPVAVLTSGFDVTRVTVNESSGQLQADPLTLWFDPSVGRAGTLYWGAREDGRNPEMAATSIAVHTVSDVYVGRMAPILRHADLASIGCTSSTAFSIASKARRMDGFSISENERGIMLEGLRAVIDGAGTPVRNILPEAAAAATAAAATAAAKPAPSAAVVPLANGGVPIAAVPASPSVITLPTVEAATETLKAGFIFQFHLVAPNGVRLTDLSAFINVDFERDALQWSSSAEEDAAANGTGVGIDDAQRATNDGYRSIALSTMKDIYSSKRTLLFRESQFDSLQATRCVSISDRRSVEWNMVAESRAVRDNFFQSLQVVMGPAVRAQRRKKKSAETPLLSEAAQANEVAAEAAIAVEVAEVAQRVAEEEVARAANEAKEVARRAAVAMALAAGHAAAAAAEIVAQATTYEITPSLNSNIVSRGLMLTMWSSASADVPVTSSRIFLFHEYDGTKYGSLYWNSANGDRTRSSERSMPLHLVKNVYLGRRTRVTASSPVAGVSKDQLFSLVGAASKDGSEPSIGINLETIDVHQRTEWIGQMKGFWANKSKVKTIAATKAVEQAALELEAVMKERAAAVAANEALQLESNKIMSKAIAVAADAAKAAAAAEARVFTASAAADAADALVAPTLSASTLWSLSTTTQRGLHIPPSAAVRLLQIGAEFHSTIGPLHVFYVAATAESPYGAIYTAPAGTREQRASNKYELHQLDSVVISAGGQHIQIDTRLYSVQL